MPGCDCCNEPRLGHLEDDLTGLGKRITTLEKEIDTRFNRVDQEIRDQNKEALLARKDLEALAHTLDEFSVQSQSRHDELLCSIKQLYNRWWVTAVGVITLLTSVSGFLIVTFVVKP